MSRNQSWVQGVVDAAMAFVEEQAFGSIRRHARQRHYDSHAAGVTWLALVGELVGDLRHEHRLTDRRCRCGVSCHAKGSHDIHMGLVIAQQIASDPRALDALDDYQTDRVTP